MARARQRRDLASERNSRSDESEEASHPASRLAPRERDGRRQLCVCACSRATSRATARSTFALLHHTWRWRASRQRQTHGGSGEGGWGAAVGREPLNCTLLLYQIDEYEYRWSCQLPSTYWSSGHSPQCIPQCNRLRRTRVRTYVRTHKCELATRLMRGTRWAWVHTRWRGSMRRAGTVQTDSGSVERKIKLFLSACNRVLGAYVWTDVSTTRVRTRLRTRVRAYPRPRYGHTHGTDA